MRKFRFCLLLFVMAMMLIMIMPSVTQAQCPQSGLQYQQQNFGFGSYAAPQVNNVQSFTPGFTFGVFPTNAAYLTPTFGTVGFVPNNTIILNQHGGLNHAAAFRQTTFIDRFGRVQTIFH